ncbi:hypothetical protein PR048_007216, partial [Dryococelus australis]
MFKVVSVFERAKELEYEGFYVFNREKRVMLRKFCNTVVDWKKDVRESKKQVTLEDNISLKRSIETKLKLTNDTVRAFVSANIPLQKPPTSYQGMVKRIHH